MGPQGNLYCSLESAHKFKAEQAEVKARVDVMEMEAAVDAVETEAATDAVETEAAIDIVEWRMKTRVGALLKRLAMMLKKWLGVVLKEDGTGEVRAQEDI
ncbi:uncharacterized protein F5891DRAFT_1186152 [Suillus fuscotomentosus]|uniref:Uncharacterized protein n=1 Tax=Suillus fuscotomentosus TaxID=1912939 RepID=A0AAD4HN84_9AGAM|nr:uncharacterized protein F5891DRAFT_1186152 [Suillus fuscotomentosus]KAG1902516.1 hypothetical protein F5891DRAFT_1186152 [Suillus fuscotomentosus]